MFIKMEEALEIVLDLARQNVVADPDMTDEAEKQKAAIDTVEDFFVNDDTLGPCNEEEE
jgi:hypothetical protein